MWVDGFGTLLFLVVNLACKALARLPSLSCAIKWLKVAEAALKAGWVIFGMVLYFFLSW